MEKKPFMMLPAPVGIREAAEVELYIYAEVRDAEGNLTWTMPQRKSDSFVQNFLIFIGAMLDGVDTDAIDKDNTSQRIYDDTTGDASNYFQGSGPVGNADYGIIIGSNSTAEDNTDYWMNTQIVEGSGVGEMKYNIQNIEAPAVVGANVDMEYKRVFTNLSGAQVDVRECGIAVLQNGVGTKYHLIARDLLGGGVGVADNASLLIMYTWRTTV